MLYLLYSSLEEVNNTLFIVGKGIKKSILEHLPHYECIELDNNIYHKIYRTIFFRHHILSKYDLTNSIFFGQDHLFHTGSILGNHDIIELEDGWSDYYYYELSFTIKHKITQFLIGSKLDDTMVYGRGRHCKKIIATGIGEYKDDRKHKAEIVSIPSLWSNASVKKRLYILSLFDITEEELNSYKDKEIILLTQQAWQGKSTEDMICIYKELLAPYVEDKNRILIKRHPRETLDYSVYFPGIQIITKPFPMELFYLVGVKFKVALTYNSTAILSFPYDLKKIVYDKTIKI
jgi:hypothetical protein